MAASTREEERRGERRFVQGAASFTARAERAACRGIGAVGRGRGLFLAEIDLMRSIRAGGYTPPEVPGPGPAAGSVQDMRKAMR